MKSKSIDWAKEEEKCFCEKWREDDEELGVQIVKVTLTDDYSHAQFEY